MLNVPSFDFKFYALWYFDYDKSQNIVQFPVHNIVPLKYNIGFVLVGYSVNTPFVAKYAVFTVDQLE